MNVYDQVHYITKPHSKCHPALLAAEAILHGLSPAPVENCRLLEIGCGDGGNLIPMGAQFPSSEFLGIDLAGEPVEMANAQAAALGVGNVRFEQKDLMDIDPSFGEFDYIVAHGVYSWVPEMVSDKLLGALAGNLSPAGIGFISYNTYPGCHARELTRDIMRYHARGIADPERRVNSAREILGLIAAAGTGPEEYLAAVKHEFELVKGRHFGVVFHDDMEECFRPVHFHEFVEHAARHGLEFVCEAEYPIMREGWPLGQLDVVLKGLDLDHLERQQYLDFLWGRRFRQTLLCRAHRSPSPKPLVSAIRSLHVASSIQRIGTAQFQSVGGSKITIDDAPVASALAALAGHWPATLDFGELLQASEDCAPIQLAANLVLLFSFGFVELLSARRVAAARASARPRAWELACGQAKWGREVTSLFHEPVTLEDELAYRVLPLLDGTRDLPRLQADLDGNAPQSQIEETLARLARAGLLVS